MKKNQGIKWKEAAGNQLNRESKISKSLGLVVDVFHSTVCAVIFMVSAQMMLTDVFGWGGIAAGDILGILILSIALSGIMEVSYYAGKWGGIGIRWGVLLLGGVGFVWYLNGKEHLEVILNGTLSMAHSYINIWNEYYGMYLVLPLGKAADVKAALDFWLLVLHFLLLWRAKLQRKNMVLALAPALTFVLALLVGFVPGEVAIFIAVVGILLANIASWKSLDFAPAVRKKKNKIKGIPTLLSGMIILCLALLLGGLVKKTGTDSAAKLVENPEKIIEFQQNVEDEIGKLNFWNLFSGSGDSGIEELSNKKPEYEDVPVLSMAVESKPSGNIYLKGYYADTYQDGVWKRDEDAFLEACEEAGFDSEKVAQELANLGIDKIKGSYLIGKNNNYYGLTTEISYLTSSGTRAFFPYFVDIDNEDIWVEGDSRFVKKRRLKKVEFGTWYYEPKYQQLLGEFENGERKEWEDWYEQFVLEQYLTVPQELTEVKNNAQMVEQAKPVGDILGNIDTINEERLSKAYKVKSWLSFYTSYNLELPTLPENTDPVEYFLGTSRSGYCMHYATAAVLMLREMGVPARYASGYVVNGNAFRENGWGYEVVVRDNRAHAWVEIYLNGIGWVPVEVTKGMGAGTIEDDIGDIQDIPPVTEEESEAPTELPENNPQSESSEESETSNEESQAPEISQNGSGENDSNDKNHPEDGGSAKWIKGLLPIVGIGAVVALVVLAFLKWKKDFQKKLIKEIRRKRTLRAIKTMNRRIYWKLRLTGKTLKNNLTDDEYGIVLKKTYPEISQEDWEKYMEIVKAAAFSKRDFSWEEMEFCYGIYQKIIKNA